MKLIEVNYEDMDGQGEQTVARVRVKRADGKVSVFFLSLRQTDKGSGVKASLSINRRLGGEAIKALVGQWADPVPPQLERKGR